jgi:L-rhamnose mutarotase
VLDLSLQSLDDVRKYFFNKTWLDIVIKLPKFMLLLKINSVCNNWQDLLGYILKNIRNNKNEKRDLENVFFT